MMISIKTIEQAKERLVGVYKPLEIYLFGSYAWGHPDDQSDLDLLVIVKEFRQDRYKSLVEGFRSLSDLDIAKDLLVITKEEFDARADDPRRLMYQIKRQGKKIYASA